MAGVYRPRHLERTVLYRVLFHYFDRFLAEYEGRFEKDQFLHQLPNRKTLGEEALIPTRSYVRLVEALQEKNIEIHSLLGGTGGGISKIAYAKRAFTYRIKKWVDEMPPLFLFMLEVGVSLEDCLTTFNWGIGFYIIVPEHEVDQTIKTGNKEG